MVSGITVEALEKDLRSARSDLNDRLRKLITLRYPVRGKFRALGEESGIASDRWKNFFYRKQDATKEMLSAWLVQYPSDKDFIGEYVIAAHTFEASFEDICVSVAQISDDGMIALEAFLKTKNIAFRTKFIERCAKMIGAAAGKHD